MQPAKGKKGKEPIVSDPHQEMTIHQIINEERDIEIGANESKE